MWHMGIYVLNATSVAVSRCLAGKKSKAEYLDKPLYELSEEQQKEAKLTDAEKFHIFAMNFNAAHRKKGDQ